MKDWSMPHMWLSAIRELIPRGIFTYLLKESVSDCITVYQQDEQQADVWTTLNGNKDDFLIYDRCGCLVYHLGLPCSFPSFQYIEESIKIAYCENKCGNCSYTEPDIDICENITKKGDEKLAEIDRTQTNWSTFTSPQPAQTQTPPQPSRGQSSYFKNQNHQAPSETQKHHPHSSRRHRVFGHNRHDQTESHEQVDTVPPGESVEILTRDKKL